MILDCNSVNDVEFRECEARRGKKKSWWEGGDLLKATKALTLVNQ